MLKNKQTVLQATVFVSIITVFTKFIGFLREMIIADCFGATWETDAFFFANKIPGMIFPAVCNSFSTAFISLYISKDIEENKEKDTFATSVLIGGLILTIILSFVAIIFAPWIVGILAPGFISEQKELAILLTRLSLAAFPLLMLQYIFVAILNSQKVFVRSQISGIAYSVFIIIVTLILGNRYGMTSLMLTVIFGQLMQVVVLLLFVRKYFKFSVNVYKLFPDAKVVFILSIPIMVSSGLESLNTIVDQALGSKLDEGTISALSYSGSLNTMVTGVFIASLSTVLYPSLTESIAKKNITQFSNDFCNSIVYVTTILAPISIVTFFCSKDIVSIVFQHGNFEQYAVDLTAGALQYYSWMYIFLAIQNITIRAFYAMGDVKSPLIFSGFAVFLNAIISFWASRFMGIKGLALGTTLSTLLAASFLLIGLRKKFPSIELKRLLSSCFKIIISMTITIVVTLVFIESIAISMVIIHFVFVAFIVFTCYFSCLIMLRCKEMRQLINKFLKR